MMTINDIKKLISKDETRTLELKKSTGELNKGMETACAFLNSDGGWLIFGVSPSLKIDGQNVTDNTRQEIANTLRKIEPAIDVEVEYIELPEKPNFYVIAIYFDSNNFKNGPYSFDGRAFYKVESTTALMPRQMYEERLKLSNPNRFSWENTPNTEIEINDIDTELLYDTVIDFCLKHLNLSGRMDSKYRQDTLTVPYEAIKEATVNMLCHRSWSADNCTPSLAIYDDRIVFQNPGGFPPGMKWQDFIDEQIGSIPANPTIANVFYRRGTMEAWGRGISLIMESCREQGLPKPEITVTHPFVNLTIYFEKPLDISTIKNISNTSPQVKNDITPRTDNIHPKSSISSPQVTPQEKVFDFCNTPRSISEIAKMLGVNDKKWVRKKYITLEPTIPDKPNSRNQKYKTIKKKL